MERKDLPKRCNLIFGVVTNTFSYGAPMILTDGAKCKPIGSAFLLLLL